MQIVYRRCCGIDVHKKVIVACFRNGKKAEVRTFDTLSVSIKELGNWLLEKNCQKVAMESTGAYWRPIYNIFELLGLDTMVVNARHIKSVPGRKTDVKDAEWIAQLLQHGLLRGSYIPNKEQRELRDMVRYRKNIIDERSREINRLEKTLEGANIKLSSFVSDLNGVSSRRMLEQALIGEVDESNIDSLIHHSMKEKREVLLLAMEGVLSPTIKCLIKIILGRIDGAAEQIKYIDNYIDNKIKGYEDAIKKITEIPGVGKRSAEVIVTEMGVDMSRFPTAAHLASWAGLCPGNNESAGKRKSGKTTKGNKYLKSTLIQCAKSAKSNKDTFFNAQYLRLVVRRGANRATVAVAHSIIIAIYNMLKKNASFKDLGNDYYTKFNTASKARYHIRKLEELGVSIPVSLAT